MDPELDKHFSERWYQGQILKFCASPYQSYFAAKDQTFFLLFCCAALGAFSTFAAFSTMHLPWLICILQSLLSRWTPLSQKFHKHSLCLELHFTTLNTMVCFDWPYQLVWTEAASATFLSSLHTLLQKCPPKYRLPVTIFFSSELFANKKSMSSYEQADERIFRHEHFNNSSNVKLMNC